MLALVMTQTNGVNVDKLFETIDLIKKDPQIAKFRFKAANKWITGGHNRTTVKDFDGACARHLRNESFVYDEDEPPILLGNDKGANPVEYALTALAGCLTTSLVYHASARGIKIDEIESTLKGDLDLRGFLGMDDKVRNGYQNIEVDFKIKSDASKEQLEELVNLAKKRSPVFDIVSNPTPVNVSLSNKYARLSGIFLFIRF
jgi:uncharacterized OsmC-like protein